MAVTQIVSAEASTLSLMRDCVGNQTDFGYDVQMADAQGPEHPTIIMRHVQTGAEDGSDQRTFLAVDRIVTGEERVAIDLVVDKVHIGLDPQARPIDLRPSYKGPGANMRFNIEKLPPEKVKRVAEVAGSFIFYAIDATGHDYNDLEQDT